MEEEKGNGPERDASGRFVSKSEADEATHDNGQSTEESKADSVVEDLSGTTAPSIGPGTTFKREPVEERLARHEQSNVDAMGQDKRRQVVGHSYGPSFARQALLYLVFLAVIVALAVGVKLLIDKYDQPPKHFAAEAPWAQPGAPQIPPKPLQ